MKLTVAEVNRQYIKQNNIYKKMHTVKNAIEAFSSFNIIHGGLIQFIQVMG